MAAGPSLAISVELVEPLRAAPHHHGHHVALGRRREVLVLELLLGLERGQGIVPAGRVAEQEDDLALEVEALELVEADRRLAEAVADEDDGSGHGAFGAAAHPAHAALEIEAALEGAALDRAALADLDRDRGLGVRGLLHGEFLEIGPLARGLGRLAPAAAHAEAAHRRHVAGGLDAPHLEEGGGVLGGQRVAAGRGLTAFQKVGGDVGQHRQGVLGGDGLQAGLELVGRGLGLVDQAQRLLHVLELHLLRRRRTLGPQADDRGEDEDNGQNVLFHIYLHARIHSHALDAGPGGFLPDPDGLGAAVRIS